MYEVTYVLTIDGHSRFIAAFSMPIKNNAIIHDEVYRYVFYRLKF